MRTIENVINIFLKKLAIKFIKAMMPFFIILFIILFLIGIIGYVYTEAPKAYANSEITEQYKEIAKEYEPEKKSADGIEDQYKTTWGILFSIDYYRALMETKDIKNIIDKTRIKQNAEKLRPTFEYKKSQITIEKEVEVTENETTKKITKTETKEVMLVTRAITYKGIYTFEYEWTTLKEGNKKIKKEVLSRTNYTEDYTILKNVLIENGYKAPSEDDITMVVKAGEVFETEYPDMAWLLEEEEIWLNEAVGWAWASESGAYYIPKKYYEIFEKAAEKYNISRELIIAVAIAESGLNPYAKSPKGAIGVMQLMPDTAKSLGVEDAYDIKQNIEGGAKYLKQLQDKYGSKNIDYILAAYNAGPGNVDRYGGIPPFEETINYVEKVKNIMGKGYIVIDEEFIKPVEGKITDGFGYRFHPIRKVYAMHYGIDITAPIGTPVRSTKSGKVIFSGVAGGYGNTVIIDHGNNIRSIYAHLYEVYVNSGQNVETGQVIGSVGSTGLSTGPHLHFEIKVNGNSVNPLDVINIQ
ncbi:MAG: peptidoglycan DD-metalloendopeptidase family protein [Thermovenabulum sp.]|uniref:peptidoglycan DD-metalloendopeptidase family protein n=1 Tax=Thermovenabulum sp. TaxID=3100335 RepID=UPI003C7A86E3